MVAVACTLSKPVLFPLLDGERIRECKCGHAGLCSPVLERTSFFVRDRGHGWYLGRCRRCERDRVIARQTPEWYVKRARAVKARLDADPVLAAEYRRRQAVYQTTYRKRHRDKDLARKREWYRLERERSGQMELQCEQLPRTGGGWYPVGPFRSWMAEYQKQRSLRTAAELAWDLNVDERRVSAVIHGESLSVSGAMVDAALIAAVIEVEVEVDGERKLIWTPEDLYPGGPVAQGLAGALQRAANRAAEGVAEAEDLAVDRRPGCATPGCAEPHNGGRFCHEHSEQLARIKETLEQEGALMTANGGAPRAKARPRRVRSSTCCVPGCDAPREPRQRFCWECSVLGWVEDDDGIELVEEVEV